MKMTRIHVCKTDVPYVGGAHVWGARYAITISRSSCVEADTDAGLTGCGDFVPDHAIRVSRDTRVPDVILEQPCRTHEECQQVRRVAGQPMKLGECVTVMAPHLENHGNPVAEYAS